MTLFTYFSNVPQISQKEPAECWYAAARMVLHSFFAGPVLGMGNEPDESPLSKHPSPLSYHARGLLPNEIPMLARMNHLHSLKDSEPEIMTRAATYKDAFVRGFTGEDLKLILRTYGPLWIAINTAVAGIANHAVVLTGVFGHDASRGEYQLFYIDPAGLPKARQRTMPLFYFNQIIQWHFPAPILHYWSRERGRPQPMPPVVFVEE